MPAFKCKVCHFTYDKELKVCPKCHTLVNGNDEKNAQEEGGGEEFEYSMAETIAHDENVQTDRLAVIEDSTPGDSSQPKEEETSQKKGDSTKDPYQNDTKALEEAISGDSSSPLSLSDLEGKKIGPCRLEKKLGAGAMGVVYLGRHIGLDKMMAVKILPPNFGNDPHRVKLFIQEARSAAKLEHPNLIRVYDVGKSENLYYIVMELVEGTDLKELIKEKKKIPPRHAAKIILEAAKGLGEAHKNHIIHRDIKPDNIMLAKGGVVKISDFGLAKTVEPGIAIQEEGLMGTPLYMAPEIVDGRGADHRSDLYALGVTLYYALSGELPIKGKTLPQIFMSHMRQIPRPLREVDASIPEELDKIARRLLEKNPDNRYQTCEDLAKDISTFLEGKTKVKVSVPSEEGRDLTRERIQKERAKEKARAQMLKTIGYLSPLATLLVLVGLAFFTFPSLKLPSLEGKSLASTPQDLLEWIHKQKGTSWKEKLSLAKAAFGQDSEEFQQFTKMALKAEEKDWNSFLSLIEKKKKKEKYGEAVYLAYLKKEKKTFPHFQQELENLYTMLESKIRQIWKMAFIPPGQIQKEDGTMVKVGPFLMDLYETTQLSFYKKMVQNRSMVYRNYPGWKKGKFQEGEEDMPIRGVTYYEAVEYANKVGKRLPSLYEWRWAAQGREGYSYPWGDAYQPEIANNIDMGKNGPLPVTLLKDSTPFGILGMAGNVAEWTSTKVESKYAVMGGSFRSSAFGIRISNPPLLFSPNTRSPYIGFRCIRRISLSDSHK